jgi:hypothetical protein
METDYQSFSDFLEYPCHLRNQRFYLFCSFVPHIISLQCVRKNFSRSGGRRARRNTFRNVQPAEFSFSIPGLNFVRQSN